MKCAYNKRIEINLYSVKTWSLQNISAKEQVQNHFIGGCKCIVDCGVENFCAEESGQAKDQTGTQKSASEELCNGAAKHHNL